MCVEWDVKPYTITHSLSKAVYISILTFNVYMYFGSVVPIDF